MTGGDITSNEKNNVKNKLHLIAFYMLNGDTEQGTKEYDFNRYRLYMDNQLMPTRLEQTMVVGNLLAEQQDLLYKNKTLSDYQKKQLEVIDRIINDFYNKTYSSIRTFQSLDYKVNEKNFQVRFLKYSFLLVSFIFFLIGFRMVNMLNKSIVTAVCTIATMLYLLLLFLNIRQNMNRYKYDWEKLYWKPPEMKKSKCNNSFLGLF